jgi:hypothetical protein
VPVIKEVPQRRLPPQRLLQVPVKEVRKERPFIKERTRSVFGGEGRRPPVIVPAEKEKRTRVIPRDAQQQPAPQRPLPQKRDEQRHGLEERVKKPEQPGSRSGTTIRALPARPGTAQDQRGTVSEGMKKGSQPVPQVKSKPEPMGKQPVIRPTQPQKQVEKQKGEPDKPESEYPGRGERGGPMKPEKFNKERRN